jgi:hypothetical protein
MDPAMQQFLEAQTQLLQNLTNTVTNLQAQVNNPPVQPPSPRNKHRELSHHPPMFTHAADPLEAEDWLKTVLKMLTTCQCDDREKVMYAAGRVQGSAAAWWDAYSAAVTEPLNLFPYYRLNPSSGSLSNNTEVTRHLCRVVAGKSLTSQDRHLYNKLTRRRV